VPDDQEADAQVNPPAENQPDTGAAGTGATVTPGGYPYEVVDDAADGGETSIDDTASFPSPRHGVPVWAVVVAAVIPAAIVAGVMWFLLSGGSGGGDRVNADTTSLLHAFTQGTEGTITTRYEGRFPPGYPDGIPAYEGAEVVASVAQVGDPAVSYVVVQDVGASRDTVAAAMKEQLDATPWQIEIGQDNRDNTFYQYRNTENADLTGIMILSASEDGSRTTIITSIQQASGAAGRTPDPYEPVASRATPPDFPAEVPAYDGALLIQSAYQNAPGSKSFAVTYITKDGASDILGGLRGKLEGAGLTVEDGDPSTSTLEGAQAIRFSDAELALTGEIVVGVFPLDGSYTQIDVQVQDQR
jgi:hypothetical protein